MGDPAAGEPPMKLKLGISKNKKAFSFRGPDPRPEWTPLGAQPQTPKRSPSSKFATTPLTLGLYSILGRLSVAFCSFRYLSVSFGSLQ